MENLFKETSTAVKTKITGKDFTLLKYRGSDIWVAKRVDQNTIVKTYRTKELDFEGDIELLKKKLVC
jgi:hypothetical protein